jgi:predicted enzyme related to lactoylglutathione lyase
MESKKPLGLRTSIYRVPDADLKKATSWYSKAFETKPYFNEPFYVGFNIGGYELGLHPEEDNPIGTKRTHGVETYWGVEDIQASYSHFISCGAKEHQAPNNVGGELMVASVLDPWNNVIGLICNPHFKLD